MDLIKKGLCFMIRNREENRDYLVYVKGTGFSASAYIRMSSKLFISLQLKLF